LLGLENLSDRRKVLCKRIESTYLADLLRFESNPYLRRRNSRLIDFSQRTNYGQNEPVNKLILIYNEYCGLFSFRDDESRYVFRNGFNHALSGEQSHL
jgi:hypothetical protein